MLLDFRTDPVGLIPATLAGPLLLESLQNISTSPARAAILGLSACSVVGAGIIHGRRNFRLRSRLEHAIDRHGWDERVFKESTKEWCGRQVGSVVCANAGLTTEYSQLVESTKGDQEFSWIPHI